VSIDENEQAALELLLSEVFSPEDFVASMVWEAGRKNDSKLISVSHEYMLCYVKDLAQPGQNRLTWRVRKAGIDEIHARARFLVRRCSGDYQKASMYLRRWLAGLPDNHPARRHRHYCCVDEHGVYHAGNISWPGGGGPTYEVLHPVTRKPCKIPSRGWMYPSNERMRQAIGDGLVHFGADETKVPCAKVYLKSNEHHAPNSVFYRDGRAAMKRLRDVLGADLFSNPKDEMVIAEYIGAAMPSDGTVLDFFAGSGTTAHAVMQLNRVDGGRRRYILCEISDAFDVVLRTRIQRLAYSRQWKRGLPVDRGGESHLCKYVRLESFEEAQKKKAGTRPAR
jgi:adenine-specific DNA-methyltransferase